MIVLDATVLIAYLDPTDPHHSAAAAIAIEHAGSGYATSALTMAETLVRPVARGAVDDVLDTLLTTLDLMTVAILGTESARLAEIRVSTGLKIPDCCVLLAAEKISAPMVATFDRRLAEVAAGRGLLVLPSSR